MIHNYFYSDKIDETVPSETEAALRIKFEIKN